MTIAPDVSMYPHFSAPSGVNPTPTLAMPSEKPLAQLNCGSILIVPVSSM
jgi:hypothetical protein